MESKGFPFTSNEQRFKWQNNENHRFPTGINTFQKTKKHIHINYDNEKVFDYKRGKKYIYSELLKWKIYFLLFAVLSINSFLYSPFK